MEENTTITIKCNCNPDKQERILRTILHQLEDIYKTLDSFDDISDITESMKDLTDEVRNIAN